MTRFIYALKEIRGCIEPEPPPETLSCIGSVNVVSINQDHFFVDSQKLQLVGEATDTPPETPRQ
jgi:hypothetical protein